MNSFNWINYNNNVQLLKKINNHNKLNKFNIIEKGIYNHIRDLFCISLVFNSKLNKKKISVLDYGSNEIVYANLINKIDLKNFKFYIFDPFLKSKIKKIKNITLFKNEKLLKKKWHYINFGSSIQYLENLDNLKIINYKYVKTVLITHTPFSMKKKYIAKQTNNKNLFQNIHSYKKIISFFKKNKLNLVFKSRNLDKQISSKKKYKTYSLNLLFLKR